MVTWTYEVSNLGDMPLVGVIVTDDSGVLVGAPLDGDGLLDPGEVWHYQATWEVLAGQHESVAFVSAMPVDFDSEPIEGLEPVTDDNPAHHFGAEASILIEKDTNGDDADTPTGPIVPVGSTVTWTYEVTNTSNVPLIDVTVTDDSGVLVLSLIHI